MNNPTYRDELYDLLADLCGNQLSEERTVRLNQLLEDHPDAREVYVEAIRLSRTGFYFDQIQPKEKVVVRVGAG